MSDYYTGKDLATRPIEELRKLKYSEMNSFEMRKFETEDPDAYKAMINELDGIKVVEPVVAEVPPEPAKAGYWRNGLWVEVEPRVQFVNGVRV